MGSHNIEGKRKDFPNNILHPRPEQKEFPVLGKGNFAWIQLTLRENDF